MTDGEVHYVREIINEAAVADSLSGVVTALAEHVAKQLADALAGGLAGKPAILSTQATIYSSDEQQDVSIMVTLESEATRDLAAWMAERMRKAGEPKSPGDDAHLAN